MAATITVICPECKKAIQASADIAGKKVRCKQCAHVFRASPAPPPGAVARTPAGKPGAAPKGHGITPVAPVVAADEDEDANPYQVTGMSESSRCPECANEMDGPDAIICLHCGYNTVTRERLSLKKVEDTTRKDYFTWLLPGFVCALGVVLLLAFDILYCAMLTYTRGESWVKELFAWKGAKMWVCIMSAFVGFFMGRFAYYRLLVNPVPPEIERH
jgi:DNA-directed RNA polymerase subunit RPC12/RpoP